jgi:hypothetical protein
MDIKSELNGLTFQWLTTASLLPNALVFFFLEHVGHSASFHYEEEEKYKGEGLETLTQAHFKHMHTHPPNRKELPHTNRCTQPAHPREGCVQGTRPVYQMVLLLQHHQLRVKQ